MASAMIEGMLAGGVPAEGIIAYDLSEARMQAMRALGVRVADGLPALVAAANTLAIAVKPKHLPDVLLQLGAMEGLGDVLSIVVGWDQAMLEQRLANAKGVAHAMPNTPCRVREGVIAINDNHTIAPDRFDVLRRSLSTCGKVMVLPESLFDAVTGMSGSGPAYVYMFIEAFADAGVRQGLPRSMAYTLAAQTLIGASRMVLDTGEHPGALKDAVASPGGTTIEAIYALERAGLRAAVMDAVDACAEKAASMKAQRQ